MSWSRSSPDGDAAETSDDWRRFSSVDLDKERSNQILGRLSVTLLCQEVVRALFILYGRVTKTQRAWRRRQRLFPQVPPSAGLNDRGISLSSCCVYICNFRSTTGTETWSPQLQWTSTCFLRTASANIVDYSSMRIAPPVMNV